jgi:hypothetical protein
MDSLFTENPDVFQCKNKATHQPVNSDRFNIFPLAVTSPFPKEGCMEFDKHQALDLFDDALMDADHEYGRGVALGLAGAFYMCGLFTHEEWQDILKRIPKATRSLNAGDTRDRKAALLRPLFPIDTDTLNDTQFSAWLYLCYYLGDH